eukprot:2771576-Amphidinium_carterae.2
MPGGGFACILYSSAFLIGGELSTVHRRINMHTMASSAYLSHEVDNVTDNAWDSIRLMFFQILQYTGRHADLVVPISACLFKRLSLPFFIWRV